MKPIIVHISGLPGCGKDELAKRLDKTYHGLKYIDADSLLTGKDMITINHAEEHGFDEQLKIWKKIYLKRIRQCVKKCQKKGKKIFLLVGSLDYGSPGGEKLNISADHKLYLRKPIKKQIKEFYHTEIVEGLLGDSDYLQGVVNSDWSVPSTQEYISAYNREIDWHSKFSYKLVNDEEVEQIIKNLFK